MQTGVIRNGGPFDNKNIRGVIKKTAKGIPGCREFLAGRASYDGLSTDEQDIGPSGSA